MIYINRYKRDFRRSRLNFAFFGLLGLFMLFICAPGHSGVIELPQTGQTLCYRANGTTETCLGTGQDGDWLAGVDWPNPRFTIDDSLQCIKDNLTGLTWARDISALAGNWTQAVTNPPTFPFSFCGVADWRLPNVNELQSLISAGQPDSAAWLFKKGFIFPNSLNLPYWTSTSSADNPKINAWVVDMVAGSVFPDNKGSTYFLWPVRGTSNPSTNIPPGQIAETGQTKVERDYDDAFFTITPRNVGVPWPDSRFTRTFCNSTGPCAEQLEDCDLISSNNIVTDNLTGRVWLENVNLDGLMTWDNALTHTNDLTVCGYVDWRLPNSKELFSLIDRSRSNPALPTGHPFTNIQFAQDDHYWASTTYAFDPTRAWSMDMFRGGLNQRLKTLTSFVWPVRGGQTRPFVLTVKKLGDGKGTVTAPGLTCGVGKTCAGDYDSYDNITITATEQTGSVFTEWGNCPSPSGNTCEITVTADVSITATFLPEYRISVNPKSLNFKNLKQGVESSPLSVTAKNVGVADLLIGLPVLAGDFPSVFTITDNGCTTALSYNETCTITVTATSPDYDQKTAELQIVSNDPKKPTTIVKLKAKAKPPKIAKKPSSLNFGKVTLPGTADKTLTFTNKGITDLTIGTITVTGDNPGDFSIVLPDVCSGFTLATDASCTLTLRFTPSVADKRNAVLNIPSNDPKKQPALTVKLKGTGE